MRNAAASCSAPTTAARSQGALYKIFRPARANELLRRMEFHHTMQRRSWLNRKESELNALTRQRMRRRRIGDLEESRQGSGSRLRT